jgi:hypothetical protein
MLTLLLQAVLAATAPLPDAIANPSFEQGMIGWTSGGHRGFRAGEDRSYGTDRAAHGSYWLTAGWAARSRAPDDAAFHITTLIDARRYRGRRIRVSAMTRAPDFAHGSSRLFAAAGSARAEAGIAASAAWRRHAAVLAVPRRARTIEIGFRLERTSGQFDADDVRIEVLR